MVLLWKEGGAYSLVKVRVGATEPPHTLVEDCVGGTPAWSPTGEWIAYWCDEGPGQGIWLVSPDGNEQRLLARISGWGSLWSRDGKTLYTVRTGGEENDQLVAVDVGTGAVTTIREFSEDVNFGAPWSPNNRLTLATDGKSFSATVLKVRMDLWLLEGFKQRKGLLDRLR